MPSKTTSDKLAKLAGFGKMAGEAPAAAAHEAMTAAAALPAIPPASPPLVEQTAPEGIPVKEAAAPSVAVSAPSKPAEKAVSAPLRIMPPPVIQEAKLVRNVVFLPEDQIELDRLEDILRAGGVRKPNLSDLVRVALRSANPQPQEAADLFRAAKALDARRKKE